MAEQKRPDIKGPVTARKKLLIYLLGATVFLGAMTTGLLALKNSTSVEEQRELVTQTGVDPDFFKLPKVEQATEVETPGIIKIATVKEKARTEKRVKKSVVKRKPKRPTAGDLFLEVKPAVMGSIRRSDPNLSALNYQRRGAVMVRVSSGSPVDGFSEDAEFITAQEVVEQEKQQADWREQKDWASYPIKLERTITVDRFLPAILINAINSELGGKVVAQIEENVFAAHGRKVLIPAGSKAIGRYKPLTKTGQERITVLWNRIITPDGINIHVQDAEMTDAMGRAGITGEIDKRYFERYGMALLVSTLSAATAYAIPVKTQAEAIVIEQFGNENAQLSKAILDEHLEIKPRVNIPAGSRILISPSRDIWFKPSTDNIIYAVPFDLKERG